MQRWFLQTITIMLALAAAKATPAGPPERADDLDAALEVLDRLDAHMTSGSFTEQPVAVVIDELADGAPVTIHVDWRALERLGVRPRDRVTLDVTALPLSTALAALAFRVGNEYSRPVVEVFNGQVVITTPEATAAMRLTDVYDVRDLLGDGAAAERLRKAVFPPEATPATSDPAHSSGPAGVDPDAPDAPDADDAGAPADRPFAATGGDDEDDETEAPPAAKPAPRRLTPGEDLMLLLAEHVDPEAWMDMGGDRAVISERNGVVMVSAPPTTHRKLRSTLRRLRRAHGAGVTVEAAVIDVPRAAFDRICRRHEAGTLAHARAILAATEAETLWRTTSVMALDRPLGIVSKEQETGVILRLTPYFDRNTGVLKIEVTVETKHDDDVRSVETTVACPTRHAGAVIDIPAAKASDTVRVLVLLPNRM